MYLQKHSKENLFKLNPFSSCLNSIALRFVTKHMKWVSLLTGSYCKSSLSPKQCSFLNMQSLNLSLWTLVICLMTVENDITFFFTHIMQTDCKYNCNILYCLNQFHDIQVSDTVQYYVTCMVETDFLIMPLLFSFPLKLITCPSDQYMTAFSIMHLWLNQITKKSLSRNQSNLDRELVVCSILSALPVLNCR